MAFIPSLYDLSTPQGVFDHVADALIKQGAPAVQSDGYCRYLTIDGCRCAAGHLMDADDDTLMGLTGTLTADHVTCYLDERVVGEAWKIARRMQDVHDASAGAARAYNPPGRKVEDAERNKVFVTAFKERMVEAAKEFKLDAGRVA